MESIAISKVRPNSDNPRYIKDEKFKKLVQSLRDFPEMANVRPIVVNTEMVVLGGNMRLKAMQEAGWKEVPVKVVDWSEEKQREFIIKDNVGFGEWDWDELANTWDAKELNEWGLDTPDNWGGEELEAEEDDYSVPEELKTDVVLGDLIEIGEHRLLCGDSTDSDQVAKLMNGEKADVAHNDPPYGMKKENEGVLNDNLNYDDLLEFNEQWIPLQFSHLKENGSWYCWGIDEPLMDIYSNILKPYAKDKKLTFRNLITWFKNPSGLGDGQNNSMARSYGIITEKCLFVMMGVQGFANDLSNWFEGFEKFRLYYDSETKKAGLNISKICDLTNTYAGHYFSRSQYAFPTKEHHLKIQSYCQANNIDAFKKEYEEIKKEYEEIKKEYYSTRAYFNNTHDKMTEVWQFDRHKREGNEGGHATPKPIPLCERVIKSSCPDNGLVLDVFLGSGSTMVAAHQLKRKCYGMELDPKYCQVIIDRMTKLDPTLSVKINGKEYVKTAEYQP
jgi:DNA modification methylase